ncbi:MAG: hypothetical protein ACK4VN_11995 [Bacteroidales bacterium]
MEAWQIVLGIYVLSILAAFAGIIVLIIRRSKVKKNERFERRSN